MEDHNFTNELKKLEDGKSLQFSEDSGLAALNAYKFDQNAQDVPSKSMWRAIRSATQSAKGIDKKEQARIYVRRVLLVAAVVVVGLVSILNIELPETTKTTKLAHTKDAYSTVSINDQAKLELRNYSTLTEVLSNDDVYRVRLTGEASVEVQKRENQFFEIQTSTALIRVLGTKFTVLAENNNTVIYLEEGKVQFNKKGEKTQQFLAPGEIVSIGHDSVSYLPASEIATYTAWKNNEMVMHSRTLGSVVDEIQRHYDVIISMPVSIKSERLSGTLRLNSIKEVLDSVELLVGGTFSQTSQKIYHWKKRAY
jgi:ferric-dicitrate binding protein FerR (iron transport regulator)